MGKISFMSHQQRQPGILTRLAAMSFLSLAVILCTLSPAQAATINVTANAPDDLAGGDGQCSLREAIQSVNGLANVGDCVAIIVPDAYGTNDTIILPAGTYTNTITGVAENFNVNGDLDIKRSVSIKGAGAATTIIDGNGAVINERVLDTITGGVVNIDGVTIRNGKAAGGANSGGGIDSTAGTLNLSNVIISANTATAFGGGGGIYIGSGSTLNVTNSTISGNTAGGNGGGVFNDSGSTTVTNSTISGNTASGKGGGLYNLEATLTVTNSTISGNIAGSNGGGISNSTVLFNATANITNSTISGNTATVGGGIFNADIVNMKNTIVANQLAGGDCSGGISTLLNDLDSDGSCGAATTSAAPLGPLADNGGPTFTHALPANSLAIDAGDALTCTNAPVNNLDQRGITRPQGPFCDIGAYEWIPNADLAVTKTATPNPVQAGNNLTYTVTIPNNGPVDPASGVSLIDTLPANVTFVSATPDQGVCNVAGVTVTCDILNVSMATPVAITIVVTPTQAGQITNTATVSGNEADLTPANNTAQAVTTVNAIPPPPPAPPPPPPAPPAPSADLSISKAASANPVSVGDLLIYTLTIQNRGPLAASNILVRDSLPAGLNFILAIPSQGTCTGTVNILCSLGTLANGASATITLATTPTSIGVVTNVATVNSLSVSDPSRFNNSSPMLSTQVNAPVPGAGSSLALNAAAFNTGSGLTLSATVTPGPTPVAADIYLAIRFPDGSLFFQQADGSFSGTIAPALANWMLAPFSGPVFSYTFSGLEPVGTYAWFLILTEMGTANIIAQIYTAPLTFTP